MITDRSRGIAGMTRLVRVPSVFVSSVSSAFTEYFPSTCRPSPPPPPHTPEARRLLHPACLGVTWTTRFLFFLGFVVFLVWLWYKDQSLHSSFGFLPFVSLGSQRLSFTASQMNKILINVDFHAISSCWSGENGQ